ncbi:Trafficking protein particle complex subunit 6B [Gracilariopsis chorda]|uniref:Trafficking protein particle complex subunit 6B n=1 Tax=Gracilariopsis chorda TaxID=448386 RepID=A0A2V3IEE5_9FLOR|nr:Trafficking protein particle complex subunit 6B [Gracilariopsis chorda]|eukprot:PXF40459.1 Trafficking protein particle complex subunit 6B [Gracilariopsis chorda]
MHATSDQTSVSESALTFLHAQIVDYHLRGHGGHCLDPPESPPEVAAHHSAPSTMPQDATASENQDLAILAAKRKRLDALGNQVGTRLVERLALHRSRLENHLDMVKFICKDFWEAVFNKHIDVLRTNHRGLYVLTDNEFRWLSSVSPTPQHSGLPEDFVVFPCGLICGALTTLGLPCRVTAELVPVQSAYKCSFNVQMIQN